MPYSCFTCVPIQLVFHIFADLPWTGGLLNESFLGSLCSTVINLCLPCLIMNISHKMRYQPPSLLRQHNVYQVCYFYYVLFLLSQLTTDQLLRVATTLLGMLLQQAILRATWQIRYRWGLQARLLALWLPSILQCLATQPLRWVRCCCSSKTRKRS